ncbi:MAG: hypothetical protein FJX75_21320 [Armatimonadetes bacterium]|nr:hypothetical protein [Armatimonadota bacterium]
MVRRLLLAILCVVAVLIAAAYVRGGFPYPVYRTARQIVTLDADARGVYWLEDGQEGAETLCALDGGSGSARRVLTQPGLYAVASTEEGFVVLQRAGATGALLQVPRAGGTPTTLAQGLSYPVGVAAFDGQAYWTETRTPLVAYARHIPATQARVVLRAMPLEGGGSPRIVAWLSGGPREFAGELLGGRNGRLYLLEVIGQDCGAGWSSLLRVPAEGGPVERVARERGPQVARLVGNEVYWTGPSEDAGDPTQVHSLRRASLSEPKPQTPTDWLPGWGRLCEAGGRIYYGSTRGVWAVPDRRAVPRVVMDRPMVGNLVAGHDGAVYVVTGAVGAAVVQRQPVTLGARLRAGVRIR